MPRLMSRSNRSQGFSLIEILLVLAIIGILSAVAIPSYMGQRRRARVIGDAISNTKALAMILESQRAESGIYGTAGKYDWSVDGSATTGPAFLPAFQPAGSSKMNFTLEIDATGITYKITAKDPALGNAIAYQTDQSGAELVRLH